MGENLLKLIHGDFFKLKLSRQDIDHEIMRSWIIARNEPKIMRGRWIMNQDHPGRQDVVLRNMHRGRKIV